MTIRKNGTVIKILTTVSFLTMIIINILSVVLPINGVTPKEVADSYPNLFTPASITFSIWGVIYILLGGFILYQLGVLQIDHSKNKMILLKKIGIYFAISSFANAAWIFSWHYKVIALSMILMIIILACLIIIVNEIRKSALSLRERIFIRLPFSVYFGWITVATIANATTLLVSLDWNGFGISESIWTVIMIAVGLAIGIATILKNKDIAYGLAIIWAYMGILIKHISARGFAGQYPLVINTVIISIFLLLIVDMYILISNRRKLI